MVQRDQWDKYWGLKKVNFLIRGAEADEAQGGRAVLILSIPTK